jgi:hypothetical protein
MIWDKKETLGDRTVKDAPSHAEGAYYWESRFEGEAILAGSSIPGGTGYSSAREKRQTHPRKADAL